MSKRPGDWGYEGDDDDDASARIEKVAVLIDVDLERARAIFVALQHTLVHVADAVRALDVIRTLKPDLVVVAVDHPGGALELLTSDKDAVAIPRVVLTPPWREEEVEDLCVATAPFDIAEAKRAAEKIEDALCATPAREQSKAIGLADAHARLHGVTRVDGNLEIDDSELTRLVLPDLREVAGRLVINCHRLTTLALPMLERVGGGISMRLCFDLTIVNLPRLSSCSGFWFGTMPKLERVHLPRIVETWDSLWLQETPRLIELDAPALTRVGRHGLWLWHKPTRENRWLAMQRLELPKLVEVTDGLRLQHMHGLKELSLPLLEEVRDIDVEATGLETLELPRLRTIRGHAHVWSNRELDSIVLPSLASPPPHGASLMHNRSATWPAPATTTTPTTTTS